MTIESKMIAGDCGSPHHDDNTQMIEVTGQPPYSFTVIREGVKSSDSSIGHCQDLYLGSKTYDVESAKQIVIPKK